MATSVIPQDIIDYIIEAVVDDGPLFKTCALVSSSFLLPSRRRLFSHICLEDDESCQRLYQVLVKNPVVQSFIRSTTIAISARGYKSHLESNWTSLIPILRLPFLCLQSFSICFEDPLSWKEFNNELKDALSIIIHSSTLKMLNIHKVVDVPVVLLQDIHLTYLELNYLLPNEFDNEQSSLLTPATSHTVIDHCVWNYPERVQGPSKPIFLPFLSRLRVFEIHVNPGYAEMTDFNVLSFVMRSLRASLTSPATLEHLKFDMVLLRDIDDFFDGCALFNDLRDADVWRSLDSIVTHPTGSRLQRVDVNIKYRFRNGIEPDKTEIEGPVLDALPLLRNQGILSVKATRYDMTWIGDDQYLITLVEGDCLGAPIAGKVWEAR